MFAYELDIKSWREFWFLLFKAKRCPRCPRCNGKLERVEALPEFTSEWKAEQMGPRTRIERVHTTKDRVRYRCDPCHAYYSLTELVEAS
jgi:hypothetical protein